MTYAKVAISGNGTKVAGDGAHPALIACGLRTSCVVHEAIPWQEDEVANIILEVWLYGALASYGNKVEKGKFANLTVNLPGGSTLADLLKYLGIPTQERGITFINGKLSAMPGLQPDLVHILCDGDRIGFFDLRSMWPFQYRDGAAMIDEMAQAMSTEKDHGLHHTYRKEDERT